MIEQVMSVDEVSLRKSRARDHLKCRKTSIGKNCLSPSRKLRDVAGAQTNV